MQFSTEQDHERERNVAAILAVAWQSALTPFPKFSPVDFFVSKDDDITAVVEIKTRSHSYLKHPTVYMSERKWNNLRYTAKGLNCSGRFVIQFTDGLFFIDVERVKGKVEIVGHNKPRAQMDREPCFLVPIHSMTRIETGSQAA